MKGNMFFQAQPKYGSHVFKHIYAAWILLRSI